jgi:hypothetical protein
VLASDALSASRSWSTAAQKIKILLNALTMWLTTLLQTTNATKLNDLNKITVLTLFHGLKTINLKSIKLILGLLFNI